MISSAKSLFILIFYLFPFNKGNSLLKLKIYLILVFNTLLRAYLSNKIYILE